MIPRQKMGTASGNEAQRLLASTKALSLFAPEIIAAHIWESSRRPLPSLRALWTVCGRGRASKRPKNLAVFPKALWLAKVAREFGAEHIHAQWMGTTASMAMVASRLTDIPWSVTAHRWDIVDNNLLEEKIRAASFVRFISKKSMELAQSMCTFDISNKSFVLHLGVRMPEGDLAPAKGSALRTLMCPANMLPVKGHKYLLEAMAILQKGQVECGLVLAGDGPLRKELERTAKALGIADIVRFVGRLPHDQLLSMYQNGEVGLVVLPSVDLGGGEHEGIPISLVEAMAHGVPVASTDTGGTPELLADGCGLLVPSGDTAALADAVTRVITDDGLRRDLAAKGRQRAAEEYAVDKVVSELERRIEAV
jgi:glycosyltransferase involved in cell wall biosynthesis